MKYEVTEGAPKPSAIAPENLAKGQAGTDTQGMTVVRLDNGVFLRLGMGVVNGYDSDSVAVTSRDVVPLRAGTVITLTTK